MVAVTASEFMRIKYPDNKLPPSTSKQLMQAATRLKGRAVVVEGGGGGGGSGGAAAGGGLSIVMILNPLTRSTQRISQVMPRSRSQPPGGGTRKGYF